MTKSVNVSIDAEREARLALQCMTMFDQIIGGIGWSAFCSWGVDPNLIRKKFYQGMPTMCLHVQGLLHKGWVLVSLNEGADLYEVRLKCNLTDTEDKACLTGVYNDKLGTTIDNLVEKKAEWNDEQYAEALTMSGACMMF